MTDPFLKWLLDLLVDTRTGIATVLAIGLWFMNSLRVQERDERIKLQGEREAFLERLVKALSDATGSINANVAATNSVTLLMDIIKDLLIQRIPTLFPPAPASPSSAGKQGPHDKRSD